MENLLSRITVDPNVNYGKPSIRNTRHMVAGILEYLAGGDTIEDVLSEFLYLEREDIQACITYGTALQKCFSQNDI